jgi:ankyrin repeat protein
MENPVTQTELNSLLILHARDGNVAGVSDLLKGGVDPNVILKGKSAIGVAAEFEHLEVIQKLIENGANVDLRESTSDWTALMVASCYGRERLVKVLIRHGANIEAQKTHWQRTPIIIASTQGRTSVVKILIDSGVNMETTDRDGRTSLMYASDNGYESVVKLLIEAGANINAQSNNGMTSLMHAFKYNHESVVKLLIKANADVNIATPDSKMTALMYAVQYLSHKTELRMSIVQRLLNADADASARDIEGKTFIDHAPEEYRNRLQELVNDSYELRNRYESGQLK